ncbi:hypothetical protein BJY00DRAFT_318933 [Aspergillus carlsbadensis]|nr:hypothetical protein BJY00DRAFT_318933 [Aspergillus carlsbadensis]
MPLWFIPALILAASGCLATQFVTEDSISSSLSDSCLIVLVADVACPRQVKGFGSGVYFETGVLEEFCTTQCVAALQSWQDDALSACDEELDIVEMDDSSQSRGLYHSHPIENLYAFESYCVSPVGAIDDYPGHSGYIPPFPTTSGLAYTDLPRATFTVPANMSIPTLSPMAPGTRKDCYLYTEGADMQYNIAGTMYSSICQLMAEGWDMSLTELETLNPSLNTSSKACAPDPQYQYCMQLLEDSLTTPTASPTPSSEPLPIRDGTIADCYSLQDVVSPMTCASILTEYDITMADFYHWNPSVGPECAGLWLDYQYCVSGPSSTSTPSPTPTVLPIRDGAIASCQQYAPIVAPTTCQSFLDEYDISMDEFYAWNPAVGSQCQGLWHDYRYCIRGPATTTSSTTGPTQTPLPIRDGTIAGCQQYAPVVSPMTCQSVLTQNGITMAEFYSWNPAVGPECTGLWHDYRYCVRGP